MDWACFPEEKTHSYSLYQCFSKLPPQEDSPSLFRIVQQCLLVSAPSPSVPWNGIYCRGFTSNRSQTNRRIKLTLSCQACVAGEIVRFAGGSAYKCKPRTIHRKLIFWGDIVYNLQKQHLLQYGCITELLWGISRHVFFLLPFIFLIYITIIVNYTLFSLLYSWDFSVAFIISLY